MKKSVLLLASVALAVLLACGVALAADITCEPGTDFDNPCRGTQEDDTMQGTDGFDVTDGLAGNDTLYGMDRRDDLFGGRDNDTLRGGDDSDNLYGDRTISGEPLAGSGNDRLIGGWGHDDIESGPGNDRVVGGPGNDDINSYGGDSDNYDKVYGGDGLDHIVGGYGERYGGDGADFMTAIDGSTVFFGEGGDDYLVPGTTPGKGDANDPGFVYEATGGPGEDYFRVKSSGRSNGLPRDDITYRAVDGEQDTIYCFDTKDETVRADPLDTFPEGKATWSSFGREHCDSLTIVE